MRWYREHCAGTQVEGDDQNWFITGGYNEGTVYAFNERFNVQDDDFSDDGISLPKATYYHNLISVNQTHMVFLGGHEATNEVKIFDS